MKTHLLSLAMMLLITIAANSQVTSSFTFVSELGGCNTDSITFTNTSTGAASYQWNFGDGSPTSSLTNPGHSYSFSGTFVVELIAYDGIGDSSISAQIVFIDQSPFASFWSPLNPACPGEVLTFNNSTWPGADSYQWDFGDGSPTSADFEPTHSYGSAGTYSVELIAFHSCGNDTVTSPITIDPSTLPSPSMGPSATVVCPNEEINFSNFSWGASSYSWDFGDGSPLETDFQVSHSYTTPGVYNVSLVAFNSCNSDTQTIAITVDNSLIPNPSPFGNPNPVCVNDTVDFTVSIQGATGYAWDFGDGNNSTSQNPSHAFSANGSYTVNVDATNICGNTGSNSIVVVVGPTAVPTASFSASALNACVGQTINFTNFSANGISASWDFDDGSPLSSGWDESHSYTSPGSYNVNLIVTNSCGQTNNMMQTINVTNSSPPFASFNYMPWSDICSGTTLSFSNWSSDTTNCVWDFGDGSPTSTDPTPDHSYGSTGTYNILLSITNSCGTAYQAQTVNVQNTGSPDPTFSPSINTICPGEEVLFWPWVPSIDIVYDFGDGSPTQSTSGFQLEHTYTTPGTYTATATITNGCGTFVHSEIIVVKNVSVANFSTANICLGATASFTDASTLTPDSWGWDFGEGSTSTAQNPTFVYSTAGTYNVTLTTFDQGCESNSSQSIVVFSPITGTAASNMTLCNGSCDGDATISASGGDGSYTYLWDAAAGSQTTATASSLCAGTYNVTINDGVGCSAVVPATVNEPASVVGSVDATTAVTCPGGNDGTMTLSGSGGTGGFDFSIDNGTTFQSSPIVGLSAGSYNIIVRDANGCMDTIPGTISEPAAITATDIVVPENCGLCDGTASITVSGGNGGYTYLWSPVPGAGQGTASITGLCAGVYSCLVTDALSCTETILVSVGSLGSETLSGSQTDATCFGDCDGTATVSFTCSDPTCSIQWLDATSTPIGQTTNTATGLCSGTYFAEVTNGSGCIALQSITIAEPAALAFSTSSTPDNGTSNGTASVSGETGGDGSYTYLWDASAGSQTTSTATGLAAGTYTVTVTDGNGCFLDSTVIVNSSVGLFELGWIKEMKVYPNPTKENITLSFASNLFGKTNISVFNTVGQLMFNETTYKTSVEQLIELPSSNYTEGVYIVKVQIQDKEQFIRFVKTN